MERGFSQLEGEASIPIIYHERKREKTKDREEIWEANYGYRKEMLNKSTGKIWKAGDYGGGKEDTKGKKKRYNCVITPAFVRSIYPSWNLYTHGVLSLVD